VTNVIKQPCDEGVIRSAEAKSPCAPKAGPWVLAATILGTSMAFIDETAVTVALPTIQWGLGATAVDAQWVVELYTLLLASLILVGGSLGDHLGRRWVFAVGIGLFAVASAWCALAPSPEQLILARAVQGVGGALLVPNSLAIIGASFAEKQRGKAIGTWAGFTSVTMILGPVLGGYLAENVSWRGSSSSTSHLRLWSWRSPSRVCRRAGIRRLGGWTCRARRLLPWASAVLCSVFSSPHASVWEPRWYSAPWPSVPPHWWRSWW
jgi:MFS family permease